LYIPANNPIIRRFNRFVWRNLFYIILLAIHFTYLVKWRYDIFIDRKNKTLYTHTHLVQLDNKVRQLAIYGLRELVLKNDKTVDDVAKLLYKLVTTD
jgi:hypothetical protein